MTTEKMTDEKKRNEADNDWADRCAKDHSVTKQEETFYAWLLREGLAEGRKRCAEESKEIIADLERKLAMRRNHICGPNTQSGVDEIDLITGKTEGREK